MKNSLAKFLKGFAREERGQMVVEFALAIQQIFFLVLTSIELRIFQLRKKYLDRGVDMTVRAVRLNTGVDFKHSELKDMICDFAGFLEDCDQTLRLEMRPIDPRNFTQLGNQLDCIDVSKPVQPLREFRHGGDHDLMLLRACYMFKPVSPGSGLGYHYTKDGSGRVAMAATSAFVQEPQS